MRRVARSDFGGVWVGLVLWLLVLPLAPRSSLAQEDVLDSGDELAWNEDWPRFRVSEGIVTGVAIVGAVLFAVFGADYDEPNWDGGILFDDTFRDGLRARRSQARDRAALTSNVFHLTSLVYPLLVDDLLVALIIRDSPDVAGQMALINLESYAVSGFFALLATRYAGRSRPLHEACPEDPNYSDQCGTSEEFRSFYSGHAAIAFTMAGLMCTQHGRFDLYGGGWGDDLACGLGVAAAATNSTPRLIADRHWTSDVLLGTALGVVSGWVLPRWLHYGFGSTEPSLETGMGAVVLPLAEPLAAGMTVFGWF